MKILIIQPWISYRGAETVSVQLAYHLNKLGHAAKIACLFLDDKLPQNTKKVDYILPSFKLQSLFKKSRLAFLILGFPTLLSLVVRQAKNFDVLNPHNPPSLWAAQITKFLTGKKIIWTVHNLFWGQSFFLVDKIIVPSEKVARQIYKKYGKEVHVLYNGI